MINFSLLLRCALLLFLSSASICYAKNLYIAPTGNDNYDCDLLSENEAHTNGPCASLERVRNVIRLQRFQFAEGEDIVVNISGGTYSLKSSFLLEPIDGAKGQQRIIYKALSNGKPIFDGGYHFSGLTYYKNGIYYAKIPKSIAEKDIRQVYINGDRAVRARTPNIGKNFWVSESSASLKSKRVFNINNSDSKHMLPFKNLNGKDVIVSINQSWDTSILKLDSIDFINKRVVLQSDATWEFMRFGAMQGYYFENYMEALDDYGEWYIDKDKSVFYYKPFPSEKIRGLNVVIPLIGSFVNISGNVKEKVSNISFEGLSFQYANYELPKMGYPGFQAAYDVPAVFSVSFADAIVIDKCDISKIASYALWLRQGVVNSEIRNSRFANLGAGGVRIGDGIDPKNDSYRTSHNTITNNLISEAGFVYEGAVGIWLGQTDSNVISHNEIKNLGYTGISVGWRWGYASSTATGNLVEHNLIQNIGRGVLSDMGGIYLLGPSNGTVIRNNVIKNINSFDKYGRGAWGIYADEGTSNVLIEGNFVLKAKSGGFHQHYGKNNVVQNNYFLFSSDGQIKRSKKENHISFYFKKNVICWDVGVLFYGVWDDSGVIIEDNIYWYYGANSPNIYNQKNFDEWHKGNPNDSSIFEDPLFANPFGNSFSLSESSPIYKMGIIPLTIKDAGLNRIQ